MPFWHLLQRAGTIELILSEEVSLLLDIFQISSTPIVGSSRLICEGVLMLTASIEILSGMKAGGHEVLCFSELFFELFCESILESDDIYSYILNVSLYRIINY